MPNSMGILTRRNGIYMQIEIKTLSINDANIQALSNLLIEAVANGAAINFLHPVSNEKAESFWRNHLVKAEKGKQFVFGAFDGKNLVGTITLAPVPMENQPFRAEVQKLIVGISHRGHGIAKMLMNTAEEKAREIGRTLLVLDTATGSDASRLYEKMGWQICGTIPGFGLMPDKTLNAATIYYKHLETAVP